MCESDIHMDGRTKISQETIVQSITQQLLACLPPILHPISSGHYVMADLIHVQCLSTKRIRLNVLLTNSVMVSSSIIQPGLAVDC